MSQSELTELTAQIATLSKNVEYLVSKQQKTDELFEEMMPIAKLVMDSSIERLDELERDGTMDFAREVAGIGKKILEGFSPADVRQLGDAVVGILDAVRALTSPEVLHIAQDAADALANADEVRPLGLFGMARATKNADVQRGMAVMMEVLKRVGHGVSSMDSKKDEKLSKKASLARMLGPSRKKVLGTERRLPVHVSVPENKSVRPVSANTSITIDGIEFCTNGHMVHAEAWTKEIGSAIAVAEGVDMTDVHWPLIEAARSDFLETGSSPNIRRLTSITEMTTKDIYTLFPKAPGRTIAKIAGCPKPTGCL